MQILHLQGKVDVDAMTFVLFVDVRYDVRNAHWPVNNKIKRKFTLLIP